MSVSNVTSPLLSRTEGNVLRALAIVAIALHNFAHIQPFPNTLKENEYAFSPVRVEQAYHYFLAPDASIFSQFFSYFGHYGVMVFIFLSAYGLSVKYETNIESSISKSIGSFIAQHYIKLFWMMFAGMTGFFFIKAVISDETVVLGLMGKQLLLVANLFNGGSIEPGPYWYLGMTLQLYCIYRIIFYRRHWAYIVGLGIVCLLTQAFFFSNVDAVVWCRYNFIGNMLPFCLGLLYARYGRHLKKKWYFLGAIISAMMVVALDFHFFTWLLMPIAICSLSICSVKILSMCSRLVNPLAWLGSFSAIIYLVHPVIRKIYFDVIFEEKTTYGDLFTYMLISIGVAYFFQKVLVEKGR